MYEINQPNKAKNRDKYIHKRYFVKGIYMMSDAPHTSESSAMRKRNISSNEGNENKLTSDSNTAAKSNNDDDIIIYEESFRPWFLACLILFPPVIPWFYNYSVIMTDDYLEFGYTLNMRKKVYYRDIRNFKVLQYVNGLNEYGGYGLRMNFSGDTAYMVENGPCIKITLNGSHNSPYVFSVRNPANIARELRAHGVSETN